MSGSRQPPYFLLTLLFLFLSLAGFGLIGISVPDSGFSLPPIPFLTRTTPAPSILPTPVPKVPTSVPTINLLPTSTLPACPRCPLYTPHLPGWCSEGKVVASQPVLSEVENCICPGPLVCETGESTASASPALLPTTLVTPSTASPSPALTPTSQLSPTVTPPPNSSPTPASRVYTGSPDNFTVTYSSSRKVYQDKEKETVNRYTFYRTDSSFAVHIGPIWSWTHPDRVFDKNALISGYPTFRYQAEGQVLVDLEAGTQKITLQCIHNGIEEIKSECQKFVTSFKFSPTP